MSHEADWHAIAYVVAWTFVAWVYWSRARWVLEADQGPPVRLQARWHRPAVGLAGSGWWFLPLLKFFASPS
jgi:hypothetical protein